ncbi:hypothetical protein WK36_14560 [Burkholderia cepacia]|nr:hypothetical protein WK36_14560 [Burkholderia cepacia]
MQDRQIGMAFAKVNVVLRTNVARVLAKKGSDGRRTRQACIPYSRVLVFDKIVSVHIDFDERIVPVAIPPREDDGKTASDCPVEPFTVIEQYLRPMVSLGAMEVEVSIAIWIIRTWANQSGDGLAFFHLYKGVSVPLQHSLIVRFRVFQAFSALARAAACASFAGLTKRGAATE